MIYCSKRLSFVFETNWSNSMRSEKTKAGKRGDLFRQLASLLDLCNSIKMFFHIERINFLFIQDYIVDVRAKRNSGLS
jgi:hypothetical protein